MMGRRVRTKICGIRTVGDLQTAVDAGADALGLICGTTHATEDALSVSQARDLAAAAPAFVSRVLVTHLTDSQEILDLADAIGVDTVQVHGEVTLGTLGQVWRRRRGSLRVIAAVHVTSADAVDLAREVSALSHAVLLDSRTATRLGGTGLTHDWTISRRIVDALDRPVILAGGLDGTNVAEAIRVVGPYGVDANSRLKSPDGGKDPAACNAFVQAAVDVWRR